MSSVMIRCPQTGKELSTGIETDSANYARFPDTLAYTYCPHCGFKHAWWHRDAWLADERVSLEPPAEGVREPSTDSVPDPSV
jgi:hypothetical protein